MSVSRKIVNESLPQLLRGLFHAAPVHNITPSVRRPRHRPMRHSVLIELALQHGTDRLVAKAAPLQLTGRQRLLLEQSLGQLPFRHLIIEVSNDIGNGPFAHALRRQLAFQTLTSNRVAGETVARPPTSILGIVHIPQVAAPTKDTADLCRRGASALKIGAQLSFGPGAASEIPEGGFLDRINTRHGQLELKEPPPSSVLRVTELDELLPGAG